MPTGFNPFELSGRTVLVTGASSGIGRETAIVLSEMGARVIAAGRRTDELEATLQRMAGHSNAIDAFDLSRLEDISSWLKSMADRYGPLHGLVHAAGVRKTAHLRALSVETLHETFRVNVDSAAFLAKAFCHRACHAESAALVFISSVAAFAGAPAMAAYAASKAALIGLTRSLASEFAPLRLRVNCIAPGLVESEMTSRIRSALTDDQFAKLVAQYPLGLGAPRDVATAAAYLLSDAARWVTGHTLVVDGGFSAQ